LHGHGEQRAWSGNTPLTLADEAALAAPLLEEYGAHVVGHSYGAAVALKLATMYPEAVSSVAVYEPVMFSWLINEATDQRLAQEVVAVAASMRDELAAGREHAAAQRFIDFWSSAGTWNSMPAGRQPSISTRMNAVLQQFHALFHEPMQPAQLALLGTPMLSISGTHTVDVTRRITEVLQLALPRAQHALLPAMGHMGPITHASEVNRALVEFLDAQSGLGLQRADRLWSPPPKVERSQQYGGYGP
jgi:pimeloyl-ACP methyl ester carboxylesterase